MRNIKIYLLGFTSIEVYIFIYQRRNYFGDYSTDDMKSPRRARRN